MSTTGARTKSEVIERLEQLRGALDALGVERLGLFGSFQRDEAQDGSDVDLLVEFRPDAKSYDALFELSTLLEQKLGRSIELVTPESLHSEMHASILEEIEYVQGPDDVSSSHSRRA